MALSTTIKSLQDVMRKDAGVDGDAQRIGQLGWLLFFKIYSDLELEAQIEDPVGAGNSAVVVDLPRSGPMLSPRVPHHVPIPGPGMERETPGQRPRPNNGHPQGAR